MNINILILSDTEVGGEWIATQTLIEKLKKRDGRLKFYLISSSKNKYLLKKSLFEKITFVKKKRFQKPFKHYRKLFYQLSSGKKAISHFCSQYRFNYVIATNHILAISYIFSQKNLNYMYFFHGIRNNYKIFTDTYNHYMIFQKILEISAWALSKQIIIPSSYAKNVLIEHSLSLLRKKDFLVLPNLIRDEFKKKYSQPEINKFKKNLEIEDKKIILYSGRLVSGKGIENLAAAFLQITDKYQKIILIISYSGKPNIKLRNSNKILFLKNLRTSDLAKLYQSSYLALLPSDFEVSSLFLREALICNLPIVSTDTGDANKVLSHFFLLKDNKVNTITNKINDFLKNGYKYKKEFLKITKKNKSQYNEEKILDDWVNVFKINEKI
jgi:glycosyltransferase involved in cell wall biosynthesis